MKFKPVLVVKGYKKMRVGGNIQEGDKIFVPSNHFPAIIHYRPLKKIRKAKQ
jgi:hypothetical protein